MRGQQLLVVMAICLAVGEANAGKLLTSSYYPLAKGNAWYFANNEDEIVFRVQGHETVDDVECVIMEVTITKFGTTYEHLTIDEKGIYRVTYGGNRRIVPPVCLLKLPAKAGDSWEAAFKIDPILGKGKFTVTAEELTVKAGKFSALRVDCPDFVNGDEKFGLSTWFAKDVGIVKQVVKVGKSETTLELKKFEPAKAEGTSVGVPPKKAENNTSPPAAPQ